MCVYIGQREAKENECAVEERRTVKLKIGECEGEYVCMPRVKREIHIGATYFAHVWSAMGKLFTAEQRPFICTLDIFFSSFQLCCAS